MTCNRYRIELILCLVISALGWFHATRFAHGSESERICVSGRYPHLTNKNKQVMVSWIRDSSKNEILLVGAGPWSEWSGRSVTRQSVLRA